MYIRDRLRFPFGWVCACLSPFTTLLQIACMPWGRRTINTRFEGGGTTRSPLSGKGPSLWLSGRLQRAGRPLLPAQVNTVCWEAHISMVTASEAGALDRRVHMQVQDLNHLQHWTGSPSAHGRAGGLRRLYRSIVCTHPGRCGHGIQVSIYKHRRQVGWSIDQPAGRITVIGHSSEVIKVPLVGLL